MLRKPGSKDEYHALPAPNPDEVRRELADAYREMLSSHGVKTDREELILLRDIIYKAEQGAFPQSGSMHVISPEVGVDWSDEATMKAVTPQAGAARTSLVGGVVVAAALLFALLSMLPGAGSGSISGSISGSSGGAQASPGTADAASTPAALYATATAPAGPAGGAEGSAGAGDLEGDWSDSGVLIGSSRKEALPPVYPETLEIAGVPYRVYASSVDRGSWSYSQAEGTVSWITGSIINWSFGMPDLERNSALFEILNTQGEASEAVIRMSGGVVRTFALGAPVQVDRQQTEVFSQSSPGITLVLLGGEGGGEGEGKGGSKRWMVRGVEIFGIDQATGAGRSGEHMLR